VNTRRKSGGGEKKREEEEERERESPMIAWRVSMGIF